MRLCWVDPDWEAREERAPLQAGTGTGLGRCEETQTRMHDGVDWTTRLD